MNPTATVHAEADDGRLTRSNGEVICLDQLLERLGEAEEGGDRIALGTMIEVLGRKSFAPMLVLTGMIALSPLSGIPGVPTAVALIILLTTVQLLLGRNHFWLPRWLVRWTVSRRQFQRALSMMRPAARVVDRVFRPRLTVFTRQIGGSLVAIICIFIAITMPPLEILPFAATTAGAAILAFGLSLMAHDGLMTLVAMAITALAAAIVITSLI